MIYPVLYANGATKPGFFCQNISPNKSLAEYLGFTAYSAIIIGSGKAQKNT